MTLPGQDLVWHFLKIALCLRHHLSGGEGRQLFFKGEWSALSRLVRWIVLLLGLSFVMLAVMAAAAVAAGADAASSAGGDGAGADAAETAASVSSSSSAAIDFDAEAFVQRYVELSLARDSEGLANMFADPSVSTGPFGAQTLSRAEMKAQFDAMNAIVTAIYELHAFDVRSSTSGDSATIAFEWVQVVENAVLGRVRSEGTNTWRLERVGGEWYIVEAHTELKPQDVGGAR